MTDDEPDKDKSRRNKPPLISPGGLSSGAAGPSGSEDVTAAFDGLWSDERTAALERRIGGNLRRLRVRAGWGADDLGALLALTAWSVQDIEAGRRSLTAAQLFACAEVLEHPMTAFFDEVEIEGWDGTPRKL